MYRNREENPTDMDKETTHTERNIDTSKNYRKIKKTRNTERPRERNKDNHKGNM